jgi:hypothetical protein
MFFGVWEPVLVHLMVFLFLTPFILMAHNFLNFIPFLTIFNAPNAPRKRVQVFSKHQK